MSIVIEDMAGEILQWLASQGIKVTKDQVDRYLAEEEQILAKENHLSEDMFKGLDKEIVEVIYEAEHHVLEQHGAIVAHPVLDVAELLRMVRSTGIQITEEQLDLYFSEQDRLIAESNIFDPTLIKGLSPAVTTAIFNCEDELMRKVGIIA